MTLVDLDRGNMSKRILVLAIVISLLAGFTGGFYYHKSQLEVPGLSQVFNKELGQPKDVDFSIFWSTWDILHDKYVDKDKLNTQELVYGAIDGLVKAVGDPYTVFFKPKESESFNQEISGTFGGVGIEIGLRDNIVTVIAPLKGTPAERSGILAGDKILKIGDKSSEGMKINEAVNLIRGPKGTPIKITIGRNGQAAREITLIRDTIRVPTVSWKIMDDNTAYVQLFVFNRNVDGDFKKIAREITKSEAGRIILDLRNNPGGLLDSAVNITSYFLDSDLTVTKERFGDRRENDFRSLANGQLKNYPLVLIINKGSASASEILAGALRDHRGVIIVGETSFGKGSVQQVEELSGKSSIKVTIAKWLTPKGISISDQGIVPDVEVKRTEDDINNNRDPQLDKARELIKNI